MMIKECNSMVLKTVKRVIEDADAESRLCNKIDPNLSSFLILEAQLQGRRTS